MELSERIKEIREAKGIRQADIAKDLGMERTNYHRLENRGDKLTVEQLEKIASALQVNVLELLGHKFHAKEDSIRTGNLEARVKELEGWLKDKEDALQIRQKKLDTAGTHFSKFILERIADRYFDKGVSRMKIFERNTGKTLKIINNREPEDEFLTRSATSVFFEYLKSLENNSQEGYDATITGLDFECSLIPDRKEKAINLYFINHIIYSGDDWEFVEVIMNSGMVTDELLLKSYQRAIQVREIGFEEDEDVNDDLDIVKVPKKVSE